MDNYRMSEKWAFSLDGRFYSGEYDSPDEALEVGKKAGDPGCTVYVAKIKLARDFLPNNLGVVPGILERAGEVLNEHFSVLDEEKDLHPPPEDVRVDLSEEETARLEEYIVNFFKDHGYFSQWRIEEIRQCQ